MIHLRDQQREMGIFFTGDPKNREKNNVSLILVQVWSADKILSFFIPEFVPKWYMMLFKRRQSYFRRHFWAQKYRYAWSSWKYSWNRKSIYNQILLPCVWKSSQTSWVVLDSHKGISLWIMTPWQNHSYGKWGKELVNNILKNNCHHQKKIKKGQKLKTCIYYKGINTRARETTVFVQLFHTDIYPKIPIFINLL